MQSAGEGTDFEKALARERARIVRLCAWLAGNPQAAEDLAQEVLLAAWKNKDQLKSADKLKPWVTAIARNVCLHWSRKHYREQSRLLPPSDSHEVLPDGNLLDHTSAELELERRELARLLDQALALLPAETARMLVDHYLKERSHAEIAARVGMNPGAVAVRLQRGKLAMRRILRARLREGSLALGLFSQDSLQWEETNVWCPKCGQSQMRGQYRKDESMGRFALRCPRCDPGAEMISVGLDLSKPYHAELLGNTKSYKPAYKRLLKNLAPLYYQALACPTASCLACGDQTQVKVAHQKKMPSPPYEMSEVFLHCPACDWSSSNTLGGLVLALPEVQRFWSQHPRLRTLPPREIERQGSPAFVTRLESLSGAAEIEVISARDTFEPLSVHTNISL